MISKKDLEYYLFITVCVLGLAILHISLLVLRKYLCPKVQFCLNHSKMNGKTVIITGCTSGIGKETAKELAWRGARVIMACRNTDAANQLKDQIKKSAQINTHMRINSDVDVVVRKLDLSSLQSIREFARQINEEESRLDVLIHNAGTAETFRRKVTEDGLEMTMATNYFGPFLLTHLLIDLLKRSKPSRIIVVASELYRLASLNLNNINPTSGWPAYLYYVSKYADIVFTLELARRLKVWGVTANCLHPGMINSGIWRNVPAPLSWFLNPIIRTCFRNPQEGAQTTIYLAVSEELTMVTGKYFMDCAEHRLSDAVQDPAKGKKLWELTEPLVKLGPSDPKI